MKETYHVPRPPEITIDGNLNNSKDSEELLSVLGFCTPETPTPPVAKQRKVLELLAIETTGSRADDDHRFSQNSHHFHTAREEGELTADAK